MLGLPTTSWTAEPPLVVATVAVSDLVIGSEQSVSAEVVPRNRSLLAAEVAARVDRIAADVGTRVKKGELLVELEPTLYRLALQRAEVNLASAMAEADQAGVTLSRLRKLAEREFASDDELEGQVTAQAVLAQAVEQSKVALAEARDSLQRTRITAPFDGVIESRAAQVGAYVLPGNALLTLTELSGREVSAQLSPEDVIRLHGASDITFLAEGAAYALEVLRVADVIDPQSRQQTVRFKFLDSAATIGLTGRININTRRDLIPASYVVQRDGALGVFIVDNQQARFVVLPGARQGRPASHQFAADTRIVTDGRARLTDGAAVTETRR